MSSESSSAMGAFDLLGLRPVDKPTVQVNLSGGNHHTRHFIPPEKGHQYILEMYPTPEFVKHKMEMMKEPSVMLLRGCDQLSLQSVFSFAKFKTLTVLEISGFSKLTTLPDQVEMSQLQHLNLSHLPIHQLQDDFLYNLGNLHSLVLRGCSNLQSLPDFPHMLECLDLSHLLIETLPKGCFSNLQNVRRVILRGCSKLRFLPSTKPMEYLEALDLSHCTALQEVEAMEFENPNLQRLDLSCTALQYTPTISTKKMFTHLSLRDAKMIELKNITLTGLQVVDISGAHCVKDLDKLRDSDRLVALDLSRTGIESVDFISGMVHLRYLILRRCTGLIILPALERLAELEVLDVSGCETLADLPEDLCNLKSLKELSLSGCTCLQELREGLFDQMSCLEKLDLSKTSINHLPSLANLTNLHTLNLSHTLVEEIPGLSNLSNLKHFFLANCHKLKGVPASFQALANLDVAPSGNDFIGDHQGRISQPNEFHLVSTFFNHSSFDRFIQDFRNLADFISNIQDSLKLSSPGNSSNSDITVCTTSEDFNATDAASFDIISDTLMTPFRTMRNDLNHILDSIDFLESSRDCTSAEDLLADLIDAATPLPGSEFTLGSIRLNKLILTIGKLKLLVTPRYVELVSRKMRNRVLSNGKREFAIRQTDHVDMNLSHSYDDSLTEIKRYCLLYFSAFPCRDGRLCIKERVLIQLWYGEGFIVPQHMENDALLSEANGVKIASTVEEIGRKVLMVLREKAFIDKREECDAATTFWYMDEQVHTFVRRRAMEEGFFDFDHENGSLTPRLNGSKRACLLRSTDNFPSSCKLWGNYTNSSEKLERFRTIRTLLNVDETVVDIKAEWFSKMSNLSVLHIGRWDYDTTESIRVMDLKFLEELKRMKQLRLLSLEGFSTLTKLSDSICKLTNLKVLSLRGCGYLEELPTGIGSLENLTHLDLTNCHSIYKLPKGLRFLSKLQVLKGFVVSYQIGGRQHKNVCTLTDLLRLERLRMLKLCVNKDVFPDNKDLQVFKKMKNLYNLKITWQGSYGKAQASHDVIGQKVSRQSRYQQLKCWEEQTRQHEDTEELLRSNHLDNLKKLKLCCFPLETAPNWLDPSGLRKLEKLTIVGGNFKSLAGDTNQPKRLVGDTNQMNTWNVKTLRLRYLRKLDMEWEELRRIFSNMTYCHQSECGDDWYNDGLRNFPNPAGEWKENEDV